MLKSDPGLYHRILTYEPIWLEEIKDLLKQSKVKCNPTVLLDYLDDQVNFNYLKRSQEIILKICFSVHHVQT